MLVLIVLLASWLIFAVSGRLVFMLSPLGQDSARYALGRDVCLHRIGSFNRMKGGGEP
jgi:hypothetical protein